MSKDIICIKVMNDTEELVLTYGLYYSDGMPEKNKYDNVDILFLIGEAKDKQIPLLGICDINDVSISKVNLIKPEFANCTGASNWKFEWDLSNLIKEDTVPEIRNCMKDNCEDKQLITNLQKIVYIDSENLTNQNIKEYISSMKSAKKNSNVLSKVQQEKKVPLEKPYNVGDTVYIKKMGKQLEYKIIAIEDKMEGDILYDQYLTIELTKESKSYSAKALRTLEG